MSKVKVVPNPYIVRSGFKETEFLRKVRFTNLPGKCKIKIFTLTGELVTELDHESETSGNKWWDMRTVNNQEIAPGLYLYHIRQIHQGTGETVEDKVGKFAVVR